MSYLLALAPATLTLAGFLTARVTVLAAEAPVVYSPDVPAVV